MSDPNAFLMSGGTTSAKFDTIGTTVAGKITRQPEVQQQRDFTTGEPKTWDDGKPMMQLVVALATSERDPQIPDDDGERNIYVKANLLKAVREAVRKSGASGLEVGGTLSITYTADGEAKKRGFNPPKIYSATYAPPAAQTANAFLGAEQPPQAPAASATAATPNPAEALAASGMSPEQIAAVMAMSKTS